MKIYDEKFNEITDPDMSVGKLTDGDRTVFSAWVVDVEEVTHEKTVKTYKNGGADVVDVVDVEEVGHWSTVDKEKREVDFAENLQDYQKGEIVESIEEFLLYTLLTPDELAAKKREEAEQKDKADKTIEQEKFLENAPVRVDGIEATQDDLVMMIADIVGLQS